MPKYFLGVDGGQSGTTAVIGDETGRVLGTGRAGPSNYAGDPGALEKLGGAIGAVVRAACADAALDPSKIRFASACLGLSGGAAGRDAIVRRMISSDQIIVTDDANIALTGALGGEPGVVVIAGTGSIAFGRNAQGRSARAGGWGYAFGDEGGGCWIAREALRAALRFEEGWGPPTALRAALLDSTGARNINDLMHRWYAADFSPSRIAGFSLLVNHVAESGDPVSLQILGDAARELAVLARAIRRQLLESDPSGTKELVRCGYSGGVFHSRIVRARFRQELIREPALVATAPLHTPVLGALVEAYRLASLRPYNLVSRF